MFYYYHDQHKSDKDIGERNISYYSTRLLDLYKKQSQAHDRYTNKQNNHKKKETIPSGVY